MRHRISVGALVIRAGKLLLVRHRVVEAYDFWAPPGGGVEGDEELTAAVEREVFEETSIRVRAERIAYIDELIDASGRMVKFWHLATYVSGEIDVSANPASEESITEAGWFGRHNLPEGHLFPAVLRDAFWSEVSNGFPVPLKLPLMHGIF